MPSQSGPRNPQRQQRWASFHTVKLYVPGTGQMNPYTKKFYKPAVDYQGPRTAKGVVTFATATLPSLVVPVTDGSLSKFKGNGTLPKALLFTKKAETTPLFKALSWPLLGALGGSWGHLRAS